MLIGGWCPACNYETQNKKDLNSLKIEVTDFGDKGNDLLKAFQECQSGDCSCPTNEYEKLKTLEVEQTDDVISLSLKPKEGLDLEKSEIEKCLSHTESKLGTSE